jgi:hypothetical protein
MSFDYTGKFIIFDFLNCLTTQQSSCASGGGYRYWSIGTMDVTTGEIAFPFPAQNPNFDLGYPSFAQNNNFIITLDFSDYSTPGAVLSQVHTINFNTQEIGLVHDFGASLDPIFGIPSFWGNDDFITIQFPSGGQTGTAGTIAQRVPLGTNGDNTWEGSNGVMSTINPFAVAMPQMYRLGVRTLTGSLQTSTNNVNFGELDFNTVSQRTITLSNNGNSDIKITSIIIAGSNFSHNGTNTPLPSQSSITLKINFNSGSSRGTKIGNITFTTDSDPSTLSISLVGSSRDFTGDAKILNAAFSGGGSVGLLIYVLFIIPIGVQLGRYRTLRK